MELRYMRAPLVALLVALLCRAARTFDTGHHHDSTTAAMMQVGFSEDAIGVVSLHNALTDYFAQDPVDSTGCRNAAEKLHFDNLFNLSSVTHYWQHLIFNSQSAMRLASVAGDVQQGLAVLGISLHATQDFYAHSNWVELSLPQVEPRTRRRVQRPAACELSTLTWLSEANSTFRPTTLTTGMSHAYAKHHPHATYPAHGGYFSGLNKDSYVRPHWQNAYTLAYVNSLQWLAIMQHASEQGSASFWPLLRNYSVPPALARTLQLESGYMQAISEYCKDLSGANNGHWKGYGSGNRAEFLRWSIGWEGRLELKTHSPFVAQWTRVHTQELLTLGLYNWSAMPLVEHFTAPRMPLHESVISVQTEHVAQAATASALRVQWGKPNYRAQLSAAGQLFVDAAQEGKSELSVNASSEPLRWQTLIFAASRTLELEYHLFDERASGSVEININPHAVSQRKHLELLFDLQTGEVSGDAISGRDGRITAAGAAGCSDDGGCATVTAVIRSMSVC